MRLMRPGLDRLIRVAVAAIGLLLAACAGGAEEEPAPRRQFAIGWSIYAGWMPWPYAEAAGIVRKWADRYGIDIRIVQVNDYVESVNQYTAGKLDGVTVTSMDALTIPAAGGKDTTVLILGDYSNGNDKILLKGGDEVGDLKGRTVHLVELSVSHYLLARALERQGLALADVRTVNTADADIAGAFTSPAVTAAVAWNPQASAMKAVPGTREVFSSADIPGEILDLLVVDTRTLSAHPELGKALAGIWYETVALITRDDDAGRAARAQMAKLAGTTPEQFEEQLASTFLYVDPREAVAAVTSPDLVATMRRVRDFSFAQGLFGPGAKSADAVGIAFPGDRVLGDRARITLRFDPRFMQLAAEGAL